MAENTFHRKDDIRRAPKLKVFLGGLPLSWNELTVEEFMNRFCRVNSVSIHRDGEGNSKRFGFAFVQTWNPESVFGRHMLMRRHPDETEQYLEVKPIKSRPIFIFFHGQVPVSDADIYHTFLEIGHRLVTIECLDTSRTQNPILAYRLLFEKESSSKDVVGLRTIYISGIEAQLSFNAPPGGYLSPKHQSYQPNTQHFKGKMGSGYQNALPSKQTPNEMGGAQVFGATNSNHSAPSINSPKKLVQSNSETFDEEPSDYESEPVGGTQKKMQDELYMAESADERTEIESADRNSQPRAVRKLSYSRNKGQEFYPTEVGIVAPEIPGETFEQQQFITSPQMVPSMTQPRLFTPLSPGAGVAWPSAQPLSGSYPQFHTLLAAGYPAFHSGLQMQAYSLPSEPMKSKECIIPYYTFPFRE